MHSGGSRYTTWPRGRRKTPCSMAIFLIVGPVGFRYPDSPVTATSNAATVPVSRQRVTRWCCCSCSRSDRCRCSKFRNASGDASRRVRLALAAAHPSGFAVKLWPCHNVSVGSSPTKAEKTRSLAMVTPMGRQPPVNPFERAIRSGWIPARRDANQSPQRPNPVSTSSAISRAPA